MSALLTSLPGDIPGLLRHGSPALWDGEPCLVQCAADGTYLRVDGDVSGRPDPADLLLDLTDPTARAHAAAWASRALHYRTDPMGYWLPSPTAPESSGGEREAIAASERWQDMTPKQIDTLARLVLRLAGRAA